MRNAVALVIKKRSKYLLIKRAKKGQAEDYWCPITGAVEKGETQRHAVVREAHEEMDLQVVPIKKVWECLTHDRKYRLHWWYVKMLDGKVRMNPDEVKDYAWLDTKAMSKISKMFSADLYFFSQIAPGIRYR